ncbi:uncharacterized protein MAM_05540 [Metarhizium album ARSEF 1941]|uniref:Pantothenate transporter liz1 n=1 Tax=Metarhizium album (strain ARSEF 1941) TaxID=1081103 RepID=A0A0B2WSY1_METAS|nr:uncharacterized protein MAM_05540 [Metarhizium album ARSEF 1941]KHN96597.1 hypothetical protein MAM_05540 [Metarhizium album ARSEF 1941]
MNPAVSRTAAQRSFSLMTAARSAARSMEPHPFQRVSATRKSAKADWAGEAKRLGKQMAIFAPGITVLLGWPYLAKVIADGHV